MGLSRLLQLATIHRYALIRFEGPSDRTIRTCVVTSRYEPQLAANGNVPMIGDAIHLIAESLQNLKVRDRFTSRDTASVQLPSGHPSSKTVEEVLRIDGKVCLRQVRVVYCNILDNG